MANILNLPDWRVIHVQPSGGAYRIEAEYEPKPAVCPRCGVVEPSVHVHAHGQNTFADLPHHGKRTEIVVHRTRYKCLECGKPFLEVLPDMDENHNATKRMVQWVAEQALRRPFAHVARDLELNDITVRRIFAAHIQRIEEKRVYVAPKLMGIDEIHLQGKPRCVITNVKKRGAILDVLVDRTRDVLVPALRRWEDLDKVEVVAIDMWRPYRDAANELMPQAAVVVDKFHVMRMGNNSIEAVRKNIRKGLNSRQRQKLKGDRFILLRRGDTLKPQQRLYLEAWCNAYPELGAAWESKEAFMAIYDADTKQEARERIRAWRESVPRGIRGYFKAPLTALKNWEDEIVAYWDHPVTNAYTEGINSVIRMIDRLGRGYSFDVLRAKAIYTPPGWALKRMEEKLPPGMPEWMRFPPDGFKPVKVAPGKWALAPDVPPGTQEKLALRF